MMKIIYNNPFDKHKQSTKIEAPPAPTKSQRLEKRRAIIEQNRNNDADYSLLVGDNKPGVSIIVTAYESQKFIEACLDSIENQTYFKNNNNFEVLVGVDGCVDTLDKLKEIYGKYRNIRVLMMNSNMGTYVTSNTLLDEAQYDNIIRFDSDDIMKPELVYELIPYVNKYDIIRFRYDLFVDSITNILNKPPFYPHGVVLYKRSVFDKCGGYMNWVCAADTELIERTKKFTNIKKMESSLFFRRQHPNSLTKNAKTDFRSDVRKQYRALIGKHQNVWIDKVTNNFKEI